MSNTQVSPLPLKYVNNAQVAYTSATTLTAAASMQVRDSTNAYDIVVDDATVINAAVNGLNGLDTGSLATATWYAVHAIGDSTNNRQPGYLLSTSATAPVLPFGYDVFRRIRWFLTDGSAHFLPVAIFGNGNQVIYMWDVIMNEVGALGATSYTAASLASSMPSTSQLSILNWKFLAQADGNTFEVRPTGSTSTTNQYGGGSTATKTNYGQSWVNTNTSQSIDWITTHADDDLTLDTVGFVDFI